MELPTKEHGVGALAAILVNVMAKSFMSLVRRSDRQKAAQDVLFNRLANEMNIGFTELRGLLSSQTADIRELRTRQEDLKERVSSLEHRREG